MKTTRYTIPVGRLRCETEVKRSRFIATLQEAATAEAAQNFVAEMKAEFPDANHNCWAYLVGPPGSSDRIGLSDDGEPHGCAGKPMLTCLQHSGLGDVVIVVTRYFGGTKLGKGGMVKAYTAATQAALDQCPRSEQIDWRVLEVCFDYALAKQLELCLADFEAETLSTEYADKVSMRLRLPHERLSDFEQKFNDLSSGQGQLKVSSP